MLLNFIPGSKLPLPSLYFEVHVAPFKKKKEKKKKRKRKETQRGTQPQPERSESIKADMKEIQMSPLGSIQPKVRFLTPRCLPSLGCLATGHKL